jgi:hypothetical protein
LNLFLHILLGKHKDAAHPESLKLNCSHCEKGPFNSRAAIYEHTAEAHSEKLFRCQALACTVSFVAFRALQRHTLRRHKVKTPSLGLRGPRKPYKPRTRFIPKPFVCDVCQKGFRVASSLRKSNRKRNPSIYTFKPRLFGLSPICICFSKQTKKNWTKPVTDT